MTSQDNQKSMRMLGTALLVPTIAFLAIGIVVASIGNLDGDLGIGIIILFVACGILLVVSIGTFVVSNRMARSVQKPDSGRNSLPLVEKTIAILCTISLLGAVVLLCLAPFLAK